MLKRRGVPHEVLNAKYHAKEASIIANAGQAGAVTIATNMAGRGTDIKLGDGVVEAGGLFVLGTERHEARRVDNQLRGRSGARATRARASSSSPWKTTCCASSAATASIGSWTGWAWTSPCPSSTA